MGFSLSKPTLITHYRQGNFYGGGPIDFVRDGYGVEWTDNGASLKLVGEWDFEAGTYSYWTDGGNRLIVEQVQN